MFNKNKDELEKLGATITTQEIYQQPELWGETLQNYINQKEQIEAYLNYIQEKHKKIRVIFSGAGTSAFVGETVEAYLNEKMSVVNGYLKKSLQQVLLPHQILI